MTLNHIEGTQEGSEQDLPVDIFMDNKSAVDMSMSFKDTKNAWHIQRQFHFVIQGSEQNWHKLVWNSNQFMVADVTTKILSQKLLESQAQWFMVCPVPECITMTEVDQGKPYMNWKQYQDNLVGQS